MTTQSILLLVAFLAVLLALAWPLGVVLARVGDGSRVPGMGWLGGAERLLYRAAGIADKVGQPQGQGMAQPWSRPARNPARGRTKSKKMMARGGAWQRRPASGAGGGREDSKRNKVVGAWRQGIGGRPGPGTRRGVEGREGTQG